MYGWDFVDSDEAPPDWPAEPSLRITRSLPPAPHSMYWFAEGGRYVSEETVRYFVQGIVRFTDLRVERADRSPVSDVEFATDAARWWNAMRNHDERLSSDAQGRANQSAHRWRHEGRGRFVGVP